MTSRWRSNLPLLVATTLILPAVALAQSKLRVAVYPFDDRTTANKDMNVGTKVADLLIAKLARDNAFTVLDRQYVDRILAEKNLKYDPNYNSAEAAKTGLMGTVDVLVTGQIDAFNANAEQTTSGRILHKTVETDGVVTLKATARLISVEKGAIVTAASASNEQKAILAKADSVAPIIGKHLPGGDPEGANQQRNAGNTDQALRKLVDQAAEEVAKQLSSEVAKSAVGLPITPAQPPVAAKPEPAPSAVEAKSAKLPKLVGVTDGLVYINKGSATGLKEGDTFTITRSVDTGMKDPETGQLVIRHKPVCKLTLTAVEETSSSGKCVSTASARSKEDSTPHSGDEVMPLRK
jgi:curli biogenesis system outer membrane secretion channel CsgG